MADNANAKPAPQPYTPPTDEENHWSYGILFQAWLVLFLLVVCFALVSYLHSYVPK